MAHIDVNPRYIGQRPAQQLFTIEDTTALAIANGQDPAAADGTNTGGESAETTETVQGIVDNGNGDVLGLDCLAPAPTYARKRLAATEASKFAEDEGKKAKLSPANLAKAKAHSKVRPWTLPYHFCF